MITKEKEQYRTTLVNTYDKIMNDNPQMHDAALVIANEIANKRLIHVIGTGGHSNMAAEELLWRAGGLAPINPILDGGTSLILGAKRSNHIERCEGYVKNVLDAYRIGQTPKEVIIIANAYGINAMTIDTVLEAKKRDMITIGVTSKGFADNVPKGVKSRHSSGLNLYQEVDYFIDTHMPYGDAIVEIDGMDQKVAPTSTLCNCFTINLLMIEVITELKKMGVNPPVWMSANLPGGDEANKALEEEYFPRVKHLM